MSGADVWRWESADRTQEAGVSVTDDGGLALFVNDGGDIGAVELSRESALFLVRALESWARAAGE